MNYNKYIGLPYANNGRDETGIDCWGLVRLFYKQEYDIDIPSYLEEYDGAYDNRILEMMARYKDNWASVTEPEVGSVIVFNILGEPFHVGIYIGDNKFIHAREGRDSVVESLNSPKWAKRIEGYYKYSPKSDIVMTGMPNPFRQTRYTEVVVPGSTLSDVSANLIETYKISNRFAEKLLLYVDGKLIPKAEWSNTKVLAGQTIIYKVMPEGSGAFRMLAMIALIVVANVYGAQVGASMGLTESAVAVDEMGFTYTTQVASTAGKIVGTMAINMAGMALINAAFPIRPMTGKDPGSSAPVNAFSGAANQANRYGAIPVVLGTVRSTAALGAIPYIETLTDTSIMNMSLVWGFGPLEIADICVGSKKLDDIYYTAQASSDPKPVPVNRYGYANEDLDSFDKLYPTDVEQQFPQIELVNNSTDGNPSAIIELANYAEDIDIALTFPEGMRRISTKDGSVSNAECGVEISIREHGTTAWSDVPLYYLGNITSPTPSSASYKSIVPGSPTYSIYSGSADGGETTTINTYRWHILTMSPGGGIEIFTGAASDTVDHDPSAELKARFTESSFASFMGTNNTYTRLPVIPSGYLKLYTICFYGTQYLSDRTISHLPNYNHEGLALTVTRPYQLDTYGNSVVDYDGNPVYINGNQVAIAAGRIITDAALTPGQTQQIFQSSQFSGTSHVGNGAWGTFLNTYGIWTTDGAMTFDKSATVTFPYTGYYEIEASSDDSGSVYIDSARLISIPEGGYRSSAKNWFYAEANTSHTIRMKVTNSGGAAGAGLRITYTANSGLNILGNTYTELRFGSDGLFSQRKDAFNFVYRMRGLPRKRYDIQVRRTNDDVTEKDGDPDYRYYSKVVLYGVTGYNKHTVDINGNLVPIRVVKNPKNCYLARTFLRLQSTNKVNGSLEGVNALLTTVTYDWDSTAQSWNKLRGTNNPASLFLYVLMHPANAYRVATTLAGAANFVDLNALAEWHEYCNDTSNKPRLTYNAVLNNVVSVMDVLKDICAAGKASPNYVDGKWTVVIDKPRSTITQHFTPHNSWGFESTKILPRIPDAFRITIADETKGYQANEYRVYNVGKNESTAELFEELNLPGITNFEQAAHIAQWHMAQLKLRPEMYSLNVDFEYLVCNRGDIVRVTHDVPMWGNGSGRIKQCSVGSSTLVLTEEIYLEHGKTYSIRVRTSTGGSILKTITTIPTTGYYDTITLTSVITTGDGIKNDDLFMLGEINKESQELVVLTIEPSSNVSAKLTLADYSPQIYTADLSQYTAYNANITTTNNYLTTTIITVAPTITSAKSDSVLSEQISSGTFTNVTIISFTNAPDLTKSAERIQLEVIPATMMFDSTSQTGIYYGLKDSSSISVNGLQTDLIYKVRARYVNVSGNIVGPWSETFFFNNGGKLLNYYTPSSVTVTLEGTNLVASASQSTDIPSDFNTYEYRFIKRSGSLTDFWDLDITSNQVKVVQSRTSGRQSLLSFDSPRLSTDGTTYQVACRAVDNTGNYSATSVLTSITIRTIY